MKKSLKKLAKKSLSLFMAVMMLMSAWVWVAPVHEHASATAASTITQTNQTALSGINGGNTEVGNYIHGSFQFDDTNVNNADYEKIYKKILYSPQVTTSSPAVSTGSQTLKDGSALSGAYFWHAETVMVYDGGDTDPQTAILMSCDAQDRSWYQGEIKVRTYSGYMESGANGLKFLNQYWYAYDGRINFQWLYNNPKSTTAATTDGSVNDKNCYTTSGKSDNHYHYANILVFDDKMTDTEYLRTIKPTFKWKGNQNSQNTGSVYTFGNQTNKPIYVINIVPWNTAISQALVVYDEIEKNPAKYTTESVKAYCAIATQLLKANANNYIGGTQNKVTDWASAAKDAVDAWNKWHKGLTFGGLEIQKYKITYTNNNGETDYVEKNYGTGVDYSKIAAEIKIGNTPYEKEGDDTYHNLREWNYDNLPTTITDDISVAERIPTGTPKTVPHTYDENNLIKIDGNFNYHQVKCTACGHNKNVEHTADKFIKNSLEPTCTETGNAVYECKCGQQFTIYGSIDALGHNPGEEEVAEHTDASCTAGEYTKYVIKCTRCNIQLSARTVTGNPLEHNWKFVTNAPTCTENGSQYDECTSCGAKRNEMEITASGHSYNEEDGGSVVKTAPTCTEKGYTTYTCHCGYSRIGDYVDAHGHDEVVDKAVAATCTDTGLTEGKHCKLCGTVLVKQEATEMIPHKFSEEKTKINEKPATCQEDGYYDMVVLCTVCETIDETKTERIVLPKGNCNYEYTQLPDRVHHMGICSACKGEDKVNTVCSGGEATCVLEAVCKDCHTAYGSVNSTNHKAVETVSEKAPTCQLEGYKAHLYCNDCKKVVDENGNETSKEIIPTVDHKYGVWVSNGKGADGKYTHTQTCTTCVEANGKISTITKECHGGTPTCTTQAVCDDCKTGYGDLLPHEYTEKVVHSSYQASEATCTAKATYYYSCKCTASSKGDTNTTFEAGDFLPHKFEVTKAIEKYLATPATCTTPAKYYYSCACDSSDEAYMSQLKTTFRSGEPAAHDYIELQKETYVETPATCSDGGRYYKSCSVCGNSSKDDVKFPEGEEKLFVGQKLSHVNRVERVITKAPGCNTKGEYYTKETCARCGVSVENTTDVKFIPATGKHNYGDWVVKEATCKDAGERVRTCTSCEGDNKAVIREIIPATGEHTYATDSEGNIIWTTDANNVASCLKEGKAYAACTNVIGKDDAGNNIICGAKIYSTIDPVDHNWIDPEVTTDDEGNETVNFHNDRLKAPATCVSKAVYYKHCATCGMTLEETYNWGEFDLVNGHNFGGDQKYDAEKEENYYECLNEGCTERRSIACEFPEITDGISKEDAIALGAVIVNEPDCHTKGTAEVYCKICGEKHKKTVEIAIDPAKHMSDETITIGAKAATCATDGSTGTKYYACCYSDAEGADNRAFVVEDAKVIPADKTLYAHENIITVDGKAATCTTDGYESYQMCDKCDTVIGEIVEIPATGHSFTSWAQVEGEEKHTRTCQNGCNTTETVDCESDGTANCVEKAKCKVCGGECGDVDANNHKALKIMPEKAPTCQVKGLEDYEYCEACTYNQKDSAKEIDITDHVYPETWTQVVTEDENGAKVYNHTKICINCVEDAANNLTKSVLTEACESDGTANCKQAAKCKVCGGTYGEADPSVHASVETKVVGATEATCTATGYTGDTYRICCYKEGDTELSASFVKKGEVTTKDHAYVLESTVASTCKTQGEEIYKCSTCPEENAATKTEKLPINSRKHESTDAITVGYRPATCTTAGYEGDIYHACCYDSDKTAEQNKKALVKKGKELPTDGSHKYGKPVPEYKIASITETEGEDGKVTKTITYKTEEPTYEEKIAARRNGNWYHVQQCTECGDILTKACATSDHTYNCVETSICDTCSGLCSLINEDNHKGGLKLVKGKAATCVVPGKKDYYECEACKKTYLDKAGNNYIDLSTDAGKAAISIDPSTAKHLVIWSKPDTVVVGDCGTAGYEIYKCKVEGCTYEAKLDTGIVATSHTWNATPEGEDVYSPITEPTCGKNGYKAIRCKVCQAIKLNSYVIVPATGEHTYGEPVEEPGTSCTDPGKIIRTCKDCGYKDIQKDETGNSAHVWTVTENDGWYVTGGNCLEGVSVERRCQNCDYYETSTASGEHDYVDYERVEPTPEKDGYVIYECKNCKFRTDKEVLKYEGTTPDTPDVHKHNINYDDYKFISGATCESAEIREYTCLECHEKVRLPYGEIEPHVWISQNAEVATCEKDGHNEYYRCVRCLKEYGKVVIPATGHHDGDGNGKCDRCNGAFYGDNDGNGGQSTCTCMCHKTGFMGFIYKIARFFWKLFKTNPSCACGNTHY